MQCKGALCTTFLPREGHQFECTSNSRYSYNLCFDGQPFFDADHPVRNPDTGEDESVSNTLDKVLDASTLAKAQGSLGAALAKIRRFKDDEGWPLDIKPNILLVPPTLVDTANVLMMNERLEDGKPNPYRGRLEVVESGRLIRVYPRNGNFHIPKS